MSTPVFEIFNLYHAYNGEPSLELAHLTIPKGEIFGITGPNGCGKSTLLKVLAQLLSPLRGKILFEGRSDLPPESIRRNVTLMQQDAYLLKRSVFENVCYGLRIRKDIRDLTTRTHEALDMVGLPPERFAKRQWFELSGGEAQRVVLASRLILNPKVLLLDEPTNNLDAKSTKLIQEAALMARAKWKTTVMIVSHDLGWLQSVSDTIIPLNEQK